MYLATSTIKKKFFLIFFIFSFFSASLMAGETKQQSQLSPVSVQVITVAEQRTASQLEVVGTVQAVERAAIAAKITGTISEMPVVLGSRVKKGDLLVKISVEEISARMLQAQAQLTQARRNLEREENLLKKKASTTETVKSMRDMFTVAQAGFREARTMLDYGTITAPFDGVVTSKITHAGDLATPGTPLLQLENDKDLQVVTGVPEGLVANIKLGDMLTIKVPAVAVQTSGKVAEIAPTTDPLSRTSAVKINIEHNDNLRTGQFARVSLPGKETGTLFVPVSAVVPFGQMDKVFVAEQGKARLRLVRTGVRTAGQVEILAGIHAGETIIISNNALLVNGQPLTIISNTQ